MDKNKDQNEEPLSPQEIEAIESLKTSTILPMAMEDETVNELISKGLIVNKLNMSTPWLPYLGGSVAAVLLFFLGFWVGQMDFTSSTPMEETYILLLHEKQGSIPADDPKIGQEYGSWAASLPERNAFVDGAELDPQIRMVGSWDPKSESDISTGYFMIKASSVDEAAKVAEDCPHLKYGGSVEVRKVIRH